MMNVSQFSPDYFYADGINVLVYNRHMNKIDATSDDFSVILL